MYRLTVDASCRRRGIAHRLIAAGEAHICALDGRRISALVSSADDRAASTWLSAGYEPDPDKGRFVKTTK